MQIHVRFYGGGVRENINGDLSCIVPFENMDEVAAYLGDFGFKRVDLQPMGECFNRVMWEGENEHLQPVHDYYRWNGAYREYADVCVTV